MKSLRRFTPLVRTRRSSGGLPAVSKWSWIVSEVIVSGSGYIGPSCPSWGESACKVVVVDTESSTSEVLDGVGDVERRGEALRGEVLRFLDRIFCVIRVWENGRACADKGLEKSSTVFLMALVISSRDVYGKQIFKMQLFIRH